MFQDFHPNYYSEVISTMVSGGIDQFYIGEICKWADLIFFPWEGIYFQIFLEEFV